MAAQFHLFAYNMLYTYVKLNKYGSLLVIIVSYCCTPPGTTAAATAGCVSLLLLCVLLLYRFVYDTTAASAGPNDVYVQLLFLFIFMLHTL